MAYEAQIAGVGDAPAGGSRSQLRGAAIRVMQGGSGRELARRRAAAVEAVRAVAPLEFVNGGGTGSLERTAQEAAVTELAAGSGLYGPTLFDTYRSFTPRPAALFALPVVRRPSAGVATVLGGGYPASGAPGPDRLPAPYLPRGLSIDKLEGAGEVQTPLLGQPADRLRIGDVVFFATPRPASCASTSTPCISSMATAWSGALRPIAARAMPSSRCRRACSNGPVPGKAFCLLTDAPMSQRLR